MKVYIITKGAYSDYSIYAVTLEKKKAEYMRKYFSDEYDGANIEEYETDTYEGIGNGKKIYSVRFDNGETTVHDSNYFLWEKVEHWRNGCYVVDVVAEDEEHAKKIAWDKIAVYRYKHEVDE